MAEMKKIGRNEACPCRSGKKFKHCCALRPQAMMKPMTPETLATVRLEHAIDRICVAAAEKRADFLELGVFLLFSTPAGDAWLLEITESDCLQLASGGKRIDVSIDETPETIVMDWTHTFAIRDRQLTITSYADKKAATILPDAPAGEIHGAIRRIRKKHSPELLGQVHLDTGEAPRRQ